MVALAVPSSSSSRIVPAVAVYGIFCPSRVMECWVREIFSSGAGFFSAPFSSAAAGFGACAGDWAGSWAARGAASRAAAAGRGGGGAGCGRCAGDGAGSGAAGGAASRAAAASRGRRGRALSIMSFVLLESRDSPDLEYPTRPGQRHPHVASGLPCLGERDLGIERRPEVGHGELADPRAAGEVTGLLGGEVDRRSLRIFLVAGFAEEQVGVARETGEVGPRAGVGRVGEGDAGGLGPGGAGRHGVGGAGGAGGGGRA